MSLIVDFRKKIGSFSLDVSFETGGGITGILGASGSGKSMTLKCIAGLVRPDEGRIVLDGVMLFDSAGGICLPPQQRGVGYLFQSCALFPNMTVRQNVLCGLKRQRDRSERERILSETLELLGISELANRRPHQLSGGQAQRAALARILANRPKLLLLDEPFSALDVHLRDRLQPDMKRLLESLGKESILVTHSRDEAYRLCSRLIVADAGRLDGARETEEVFRSPGTLAASEITGCKNNAPAERRSAGTVYVPMWGIELTVDRDFPGKVDHVGLRAHYFGPDVEENRYPVEFVSRMDEPFETVFEFRYLTQRPGSPNLWWRVPRGALPDRLPDALGFPAADVMPLCG